MSGVSRTFVAVLFTSALMLTTGCGSNKGDIKVTPQPVSGIVRFNDKPMKGGGSIVFFPKDGSGKEASGTIADDGTFVLKTYEDGDGAAAGEYRVVIYQTTAKEPEPSADNGQTSGTPVDTVPKKERIPKIYANSVNSPIIKTVKEGNNDIPIDLKPYQPPVNKGA